jgi:hypothetical protein
LAEASEPSGISFQPMKQPRRNSAFNRTLNVLAWVLIALLVGATLWTIQWAAHQPKVHSIWGEPSETPLT